MANKSKYDRINNASIMVGFSGEDGRHRHETHYEDSLTGIYTVVVFEAMHKGSIINQYVYNDGRVQGSTPIRTLSIFMA